MPLLTNHYIEFELKWILYKFTSNFNSTWSIYVRCGALFATGGEAPSMHFTIIMISLSAGGVV